eukprot:6910053-Prymnesium_polylepis.2
MRRKSSRLPPASPVAPRAKWFWATRELGSSPHNSSRAPDSRAATCSSARLDARMGTSCIRTVPAD